MTSPTSLHTECAINEYLTIVKTATEAIMAIQNQAFEEIAKLREKHDCSATVATHSILSSSSGEKPANMEHSLTAARGAATKVDRQYGSPDCQPEDVVSTDNAVNTDNNNQLAYDVSGATVGGSGSSASVVTSASQVEAVSSSVCEENDDVLKPGGIYCFCRQPPEGKMLRCDNDGCKYKWLHQTCLLMNNKAVRRMKQLDEWECAECCGEDDLKKLMKVKAKQIEKADQSAAKVAVAKTGVRTNDGTGMKADF